MTLRAATGDETVLQAPKHVPRATIQVPTGDMDGNARGSSGFRIWKHLWARTRRRIRPLSFACALGAAYVPFADTKEEREATGDPRLSIRERYKDVADYRARIQTATQALLASGFLLPADAEEIVAAAATVAPP
jgi:hypothetical protein